MEGQKLLPPSIKFPLFPFLAALYLPVFPISYLARHYYDKKSKKNRKIRPSVWSGVSHTAPISSFSLDEHLMSCLETMEKIGLYIMLFSILFPVSFKLPLPGPVILKPALMGLLEITTGIQTICEHTSGLTGLLLVTASVAFAVSAVFSRPQWFLQCTAAEKCRTLHPALYLLESPSQFTFLRILLDSLKNLIPFRNLSFFLLFFLRCCLCFRFLLYKTTRQFLTVVGYNVIAGLHGTHKGVKTSLCSFHGMIHNILKATQHIVCILVAPWRILLAH